MVGKLITLSPTPVKPSETPTAPPPKTSVITLAAAATLTWAPSLTPLPPSPTPSPLPPPPTPTATRVPGDAWLITAENLARLAPLASLGNSSLDQINLTVWAPDGTRLAVGGKTGVVLLDALTWKVLWRTEFPDAVRLQFSQDGSRLLVGGVKTTRGVLLESATGKILSTLFAGQIALSPDGKTVAGDGIRDALSNEVIRALKFPQLTKPDFESPVETAFSPDGRQVVAGMSGGGFTAWDVASGEISYRVAGSDPYNSCQGTSNTDWMVLVCAIPSGDFSKVSLQANFINLNRPTAVGQFTFPNVANYKNHHYALLPGQSLIAWADGAKITLYDLAAGFQPVRALPGLPGNASLSFSPDKKNPRLAYWNNRSLQIWDINAPQALAEFGGPAVNQMAFSPKDARLLAYGKYDGSLTAWNVATQERLLRYPAAHPQGPVGVAFAPDGKSLASGGGDFHVRLWKLDPPTPTPLVDRQVYANVFQLAYAPDGKKLGVAYTSAYYVHLYPGSLDEQAPLRIFPSDSVAWIEIAISPSGDKLAIGNEAGTVELRNLADGALLKRFESPRRSAVRHLAFSADGSLLAAAARGLWDLKTGALLVDLGADTVSVALSPDQCLLAAGQANGTLRLWNVQTRQFIEPALKVFTSRIEDLTFSPDGRLLALGSWDGDVVLWGVPDVLKQPVGEVPKVKCGQ